MKSAVWFVALGLTLVAFSCDPELSLKAALEGKRCGSQDSCVLGYECDTTTRFCVPMTGSAGAGTDPAGAGTDPMDPPPRGAGGAGGSEAIGDGMDTMSSDVPDAADAAPDCKIQLFRDRDGDGYGSDAPGDQMPGCPRPGWVSQGGDCFDAEPDAGNLAAKVHPGQPEFFAEGYPRPGQPGGVSFDYDCVRGEEADPTNRYVAAVGACSGASPPTSCSSFAGMVPANTERSGAGVNALCGSTTFRTCDPMNFECVPTLVDRPEFQFRCH